MHKLNRAEMKQAIGYIIHETLSHMQTRSVAGSILASERDLSIQYEQRKTRRHFMKQASEHEIDLLSDGDMTE